MTADIKHTCHVPHCGVEVPPKFLMCGRHWRFVSSQTQQRVYRHYQPGQEEGRHHPTKAWFDAADQAIQEAQAADFRRPRVGLST